ncbi:hypothetical protein BGZ95_005769 [Linnemannia exigua]|uniref:Uncharacterized protein n=1 Tax=Linnemannia exigua TaxID=604196 RepID=A0AAD4DGG9_9FUNG|nr:hypothetical protein BGZ95_005769 [Linnemannia exigua]
MEAVLSAYLVLDYDAQGNDGKYLYLVDDSSINNTTKLRCDTKDPRPNDSTKVLFTPHVDQSMPTAPKHQQLPPRLRRQKSF